MIDSIEWLLRHAAIAVCLVLGTAASSPAQLAPPPRPEAPAGPELFPRYDFHLAANWLGSGDPRFEWDTHFGGDFDLFDYVHGRATFLADYQAVIGNELRAFDPNQGNYTLEAATSWRVRGTELYLVFHHVSRHFSDRPKRVAIAWNVLQARAMKRLSVKGVRVDLRGDAGGVPARAYVDYSWTADLDVRAERPINPHLGVYARGYVEAFGIEKSVSTRNTQSGGRLEAGVRLPGKGGAIELFGGWEQVVDADPVEQRPLQWGFLGFRLASE